MRVAKAIQIMKERKYQIILILRVSLDYIRLYSHSPLIFERYITMPVGIKAIRMDRVIVKYSILFPCCVEFIITVLPNKFQENIFYFAIDAVPVCVV